MQKFLKPFSVGVLIFIPLITSAQLSGTRTLLQNASNIITGIIIPLVFALALLYFFWGVAKYIRSEGAGKAEGRQVMVWGVVALFVISAVWGLVEFLRREFAINQVPNINIPTINGGGAGTGDINT